MKGISARRLLPFNRPDPFWTQCLAETSPALLSLPRTSPPANIHFQGLRKLDITQERAELEAALWAERNRAEQKMEKVLEKKRALPAAPSPHRRRLRPSLQPAAMIAADKGRGAILSTRERLAAPGGLQPLWKVTGKEPWLHTRIRHLPPSSRVPAAWAAPPLAAFNTTGRPETSPQTKWLRRETRMAQRGRASAPSHSLLGRKGVAIRLSRAKRCEAVIGCSLEGGVESPGRKAGPTIHPGVRGGAFRKGGSGGWGRLPISIRKHSWPSSAAVKGVGLGVLPPI